MVPAEKDREQPLGDNAARAPGDLLADDPHGVEVPGAFLGLDELGDGDAGVPEVRYRVTELGDGVLEARVADGARAHVDAAAALAEVHGHTEDPDGPAPVLRQKRSPPTSAGPPPPRTGSRA